MISLVRVDNRLIHGQVVEAWLPHLKVERVVVADDEAAGSPLIRAAMGLAVQSAVEVQVRPLAEVDWQGLSGDPVKTLLLVRDIKHVLAAREQGLTFAHLNLGNIHFTEGRRQVSASVFLSAEELSQLEELVSQGTQVECRGVPGDRPVSYPEMVDRFGKGP